MVTCAHSHTRAHTHTRTYLTSTLFVKISERNKIKSDSTTDTLRHPNPMCLILEKKKPLLYRHYRHIIVDVSICVVLSLAIKITICLWSFISTSKITSKTTPLSCKPFFLSFICASLLIDNQCATHKHTPAQNEKKKKTKKKNQPKHRRFINE